MQETRKKTQEQFVELKEATVTDLVTLQSQLTKSAKEHEEMLRSSITNHVKQVEAEMQRAHKVVHALETDIRAQLQQMHQNHSETLKDTVKGIEGKLEEQAKYQQQVAARLDEGIQKLVSEASSRQDKMHLNAVEMIRAVEARLTEHEAKANNDKSYTNAEMNKLRETVAAKLHSTEQELYESKLAWFDALFGDGNRRCRAAVWVTPSKVCGAPGAV